MIKYNNTQTFIHDLNKKYPERLIILLEVDYTEAELLDYISDRTVEDFYPQLFRDGLLVKRALMDGIGSPQIKTYKSVNPNMGELALDCVTGQIMTFDGSIWITVT